MRFCPISLCAWGVQAWGEEVLGRFGFPLLGAQRGKAPGGYVPSESGALGVGGSTHCHLHPEPPFGEASPSLL